MPRSSLSDYLSGATIMPVDVADAVVLALGATPAEARKWATAWERAIADQTRPVGAERATGPRQLPAAVAAFVGRETYLKKLDGLLKGGHSSAVVISAIAGTAGVGKTALAVRWAHQVADRFPDGQLYANLHGYGPGEPLEATTVLGSFLRALGVDTVPPGLEERAMSYRSLLSGKRALIVLDNARTVDQIRPLLPGSAECLVLVTSRDALAGLVARDGARRLDLDRLPVEESRELLGRLVGDQRVLAEPDACGELVRLCAGLPLALRIVAERIASRPRASLAELVEDLQDVGRTLDVLDATGDPLTDVRSVFSWSYRALSEPAARLFRLLGLCPGPDIDAHGAAAAAGVPVAEARGLLDHLADTYLLQRGVGGRYGMHDLLRAYARELACATETAGQRHVALTGLFDWLLATTNASMDLINPHRRTMPDPTPTALSTPLRFDDVDAAGAWLEAEHAVLVAAVRLGTQDEWPVHAWQLAHSLWMFFYTRRYLDSWFGTLADAMAAAERLDDRFAQAELQHLLGIAYDATARYETALEHFQQALTLRRAVGDRRGEGVTLNGIGAASYRLRRLEAAAENYRLAAEAFGEIGFQHGELTALGNAALLAGDMGRYEEAISLFTEVLQARIASGDQHGQPMILDNLGRFHHRLGREDEALSFLHRALAAAEELGDQYLLANTCEAMAAVHAHLADYKSADRYAHRALALARANGDRNDEVGALTTLGQIHLRQGDPTTALERYSQALAVCHEFHQPGNEHAVHNGLGQTHIALGDTATALHHHTIALALADGANPYEQAHAEFGIASALLAAEGSHGARRHLEAALRIFTELGVPESEAVRAVLATVE
ncbi:tetratricopeptide repeat protein [Catenulispora sp. GAS73]|uniref:ATP-binding protein n=1 Tax=Catenulispora sp. GAS73 TaxID=3156269 RepID=UPI003510FE62